MLEREEPSASADHQYCIAPQAVLDALGIQTVQGLCPVRLIVYELAPFASHITSPKSLSEVC